MGHFDDIYDIAADEHGIVTAAQMREEGVPKSEVSRWCSEGRLLRRGHGVYKLARWVPTPNDAFAEAVALVGEGSYLWGEAVLSMHGLALVDPRTVTVATPRRVRRSLPAWVEAVPAPPGVRPTSYDGIASQSVADAIRACAGRVMPARLAEAARNAREEGLLGPDELAGLERMLA